MWRYAVGAVAVGLLSAALIWLWGSVVWDWVKTTALYRSVFSLNPAYFEAFDFSAAITAIIATFGVLVAVSITDFFDESKNHLHGSVRSWATWALLSLLLRYIVGSAIHLTRTYGPPSAPAPARTAANSPSNVLFLKDVAFLILFGVIAIHMTHASNFFHFLQQAWEFVGTSLIWSAVDYVINSGRITSRWVGNTRFAAVWAPIDFFQFLATLGIYYLLYDKAAPSPAAIALALVYGAFFLLDVRVMIRVSALKA